MEPAMKKKVFSNKAIWYKSLEIENNTWARVDMEFLFELNTRVYSNKARFRRRASAAPNRIQR